MANPTRVANISLDLFPEGSVTKIFVRETPAKLKTQNWKSCRFI